MIDLRTPNLRDVPVGTEVKTSKGFVFVLIVRKDGKESWKDDTSGLTWHDTEDRNCTHHEAVEKFKDSLPTIEEFKTAEEHGFREVLPNMGHWYWSSSLSSYVTAVARIFSGNDGYGSFYYRGSFNSVRCIERAK